MQKVPLTPRKKGSEEMQKRRRRGHENAENAEDWLYCDGLSEAFPPQKSLHFQA